MTAIIVKKYIFSIYYKCCSISLSQLILKFTGINIYSENDIYYNDYKFCNASNAYKYKMVWIKI